MENRHTHPSKCLEPYTYCTEPRIKFPFHVLSEHFKDCFLSKQLWIILKNGSEAYQRDVRSIWCHERSMVSYRIRFLSYGHDRMPDKNMEGAVYFGSQFEGEELMEAGEWGGYFTVCKKDIERGINGSQLTLSVLFSP